MTQLRKTLTILMADGILLLRIAMHHDHMYYINYYHHIVAIRGVYAKKRPTPAGHGAFASGSVQRTLMDLRSLVNSRVAIFWMREDQYLNHVS